MRQIRRRAWEAVAPHWRSVLVKALGFMLGWSVIAVPASYVVFMNSSRTTVIAGHDAEVSPTRSGYAVLDLGAFLPNLRYPTDQWVGVRIDVGKTDLGSYDALLDRYAFIASQPGGQIAKIRGTIAAIALDSVETGALIGLAGPALWMLVGGRRRSDLFGQLTPRRVGVGSLVVVVVGALAWQPWSAYRASTVGEQIGWTPVGEALPDMPIEGAALRLEIQNGLLSSGTQRLIESAFDTYRRSVAFYDEVEDRAVELGEQLRQPEEGDTVALLVSDRHDNIGMDPVARAIADAGGATMLLDAGDDTSTGEPWEAFSLDSLAASFDDYEHRYAVAGNHDHGRFVTDYLDDLGFTMLQGEPVDGPDGIRLLGADDPRSSGLGTWRMDTGTTLAEQGTALADTACQGDEDGARISTLLVHDATVGNEALRRGCVDLVLGGHIHAQLGPTRMEGDNGKRGYSYTNGTTGGAAYAIAIGSKLRRDAQVTLVTYREAIPIGLQPVTVRTVGDFVVGSYVDLSFTTR